MFKNLKKILFLFVFVLSSCVAMDKYDKEYKKVIVGRIIIVVDDNEFDFTKIENTELKSFVKQPLLTMNPFRDDIRGNGLVIGNAYKSEYKIDKITGKDDNLIFTAKIPEIIIKVGDEQGIYYFGCLKFIYIDGVLKNIELIDNREEDLDDAKKYISKFKKLPVIDLTSNIKSQLLNKVQK